MKDFFHLTEILVAGMIGVLKCLAELSSVVI